MPAILVLLAMTGRAMRWNSGKSTRTFRDPRRFEAGEAIRTGHEFAAQALQVLYPFVEAQILHLVDAHFHWQEGAELFVHAAHQVLAVDAHDMVAAVELFQHAAQLATQPFGDAHP